jgi:collagenase-like PrtC family protease
MCTQPCRKLYKLGKQEGILAQSADIYGIEALPHLLRIGIDGLKIEGRMRSPLYVYLTTKIYKEAIGRAENGESPLITDWEKSFDVVFNRASVQATSRRQYNAERIRRVSAVTAGDLTLTEEGLVKSAKCHRTMVLRFIGMTRKSAA